MKPHGLAEGEEVADQAVEAADLRLHVAEDAVEVEGDGGARFLCHFVFDGEIEVVGSVAEAFERALVLGEHRGADARNVVEINAGEREVAQVFLRCDLDATELREVGLEGPAEEALQATAECTDFVLKGAGAFEMLDALVERLVEADDHGGCSVEAGFENVFAKRRLHATTIRTYVLNRQVSPELWRTMGTITSCRRYI